MRELEWEDMGVKIDGRQLHHLRVLDDIMIISRSIGKAERMLADFHRVYATLVRSAASEFYEEDGHEKRSSYVYLGREVNMASDPASDLGRRERAVWRAEAWAIRKQDEHAINLAQWEMERTMLGVTRFTQVRKCLRSSKLHRHR
ncbi:unnamed protein product [Heligmosomoides polygyrus]|uniref:Reverse transcriptase domain-containing protein n=1 Tax=Heligmosomoides polygyrus TaxID=6339 RepID=A0A183FAD8_HELPZ|nr:unnamed protein product [Heligmosomoides polygyrus]